MTSDNIYREQIMDHYKSPHNHGILDNYTFKTSENNPLCGDEIELQVKLANDKIEDIKFSGNGCAISQAASSMLTDLVKGKTLDEVKQLTRDNIIEMLGIDIGPVRVKCAVLSLVALKNGIDNYEKGAQNG